MNKFKKSDQESPMTVVFAGRNTKRKIPIVKLNARKALSIGILTDNDQFICIALAVMLWNDREEEE